MRLRKLKEDGYPEVLKFRVTCNRAGEKHCFSSNEAAKRDLGCYFKIILSGRLI